MIQLPRLVFGTTSLGNLFRAATDEEKGAIINQWFQVGTSPVVIDSAGKYGAGLALEVIGRELERLNLSPEQVLISNKLGWRRVPLTTPEPTFEPGAWVDIHHDAVQDISYDGILRCWKEGNELLGKYETQLVSVHDPDEYLAAATNESDRARRLNDIIDAYRALVELRDSGQVRAVGVGAKDWRSILELSHHCDFDWVMFANSFTLLHHPTELVEFMQRLADRGVAIINSALFHGGFLLGGEFYDYRKIDPTDPKDAEHLAARETITRLCKKHGVSVFDCGVAFGKSHPAIQSIALSSSRSDRVQSHVASLDAAIPSQLWSDLRESGIISPDYAYI